MRYWQVQADLRPGRLLFGVRAEDRETARDKAVTLVDRFRVPVDLEILEIPPPPDRLPAERLIV